MDRAELRRLSRWKVACAITLVALGSVACERQRWDVGETLRAVDGDVAAALGDTTGQHIRDIRADEVPDLKYPRSLRPCCAFGARMKVEVGRVPVPGVEIGNLVDPDQLGAHRYDNGFLSIDTKDERGTVDIEGNGLVYTCRGGFIDLAHVRDNADNTLSLLFSVGRLLESGGTIEVPPQGAAMRVVLKPLAPEVIARLGRRNLSVAMGQWLAYQFSIWHEITTFWGYASLPEWPEKISAFSPEDLYSNQLGVRLVGGIVAARGVRSEQEYALNMDAWLKRALERLEIVSLDETLRAMEAVDGAWWDSSKRIPDWRLVRRRQFHPEPFIAPWRLEEASPGDRGEVEPLEACRGSLPPLVFHVPAGFAGVRFADYATVEFEVEDLLLDNGFPLPRSDSRVVTQRDFPFLIEAARRETIAELGPGADRP